MSLRLISFGLVATLSLIMSIPAFADTSVILDRNQEAVITGDSGNPKLQSLDSHRRNPETSSRNSQADIQGYNGPVIQKNPQRYRNRNR